MVELDTGNVGIKPGWVRLNFNYFIPKEEFDFLLQALEWIAEHGWKLMPLYHFDDRNGLWKIDSYVENKKQSLTALLSDQSFKLSAGKNWMKKSKRNGYFKFADELTKKMIKKDSEREMQTYHFNQLKNPLRWYALAQDIDIK